MKHDIREIDLTHIKSYYEAIHQEDPAEMLRRFQAQQVVAYVMAGGGFIGRSATEQPAGFYIDSRASRRPYPEKAILQVVSVLIVMAEVLGLDPNNLPEMPDFHGSGVF